MVVYESCFLYLAFSLNSLSSRLPLAVYRNSPHALSQLHNISLYGYNITSSQSLLVVI